MTTRRLPLDGLQPDLTENQLERVSWFLDAVGAADVRWLPRSKSVVLHFEDREKHDDLSTAYDEHPERREQAVEFFARALNTMVNDVTLTGIFPADG